MRIRKAFLVLVLGLVLGSVASAEPPRHMLSPEGCQNVAMAVSYAAHKASEGETANLIVIKDKASLPPVFLEHLRLLERVALKYRKMDAHTHFQSYLAFCLESDGDIESMNGNIRDMLGEKVADSVL